MGKNPPKNKRVKLAPSKTFRVAHYVRVSTRGQDPDSQTYLLEETSKRLNETVVAVVVEVATSDKKLPKREKLLEMARRGEIDAIRVTDVSRWTGDDKDLMVSLETLTQNNVSLLSLEGLQLDVRTFEGRVVASFFGQIVAWRLKNIRESVRRGQQKARAQGKHIGRKPGFTPKVERVREQVEKLHGMKYNQSEIVREIQRSRNVKITRGTVQNIIKAYKDQQQALIDKELLEGAHG